MQVEKAERTEATRLWNAYRCHEQDSEIRDLIEASCEAEEVYSLDELESYADACRALEEIKAGKVREIF